MFSSYVICSDLSSCYQMRMHFRTENGSCEEGLGCIGGAFLDYGYGCSWPHSMASFHSCCNSTRRTLCSPRLPATNIWLPVVAGPSDGPGLAAAFLSMVHWCCSESCMKTVLMVMYLFSSWCLQVCSVWSWWPGVGLLILGYILGNVT